MKLTGAQVKHADDRVNGVFRTNIPFPLTLPNGALNVHRLTTREIEVLKLISEGLCNKEIAAMVQRSIKTIEKHRQQVMDKTNIRNIASLTKFAIRSGLTTPDETKP